MLHSSAGRFSDAEDISSRGGSTLGGNAEELKKQAPVLAELHQARKQGDELRSQLAQASEQLKTAQGRVSQLEAQLKQAPAAANLDQTRKQGEELRSQLAEQLKTAQRRVSQLEAQLKQAPAAAAVDQNGKEATPAPQQ